MQPQVSTTAELWYASCGSYDLRACAYNTDGTFHTAYHGYLLTNSFFLFSFSFVECVGNQGSCLTPPPFTGTLVAVALGVGTQNYTCSSSTAAPTPNGALATLYDISCPISTVSSAAHFLTELAFKANVFNDYPIPSGLGYEMIGNHYFTSDAKSAVFEFTPNNSNNKFKFVGGKVENITAPSYAVDGSVDWLILGRTAGLEYLSHDVKVGK